MKSLTSFISEGPEEKKQDKLRIITISTSYNTHTAKRISEEAKKLGHDVFTVNISGAFIRYEEGTYKIYNSNNDTGFDISSVDTIAIVRGTVRHKDSYLDLLSQLEKIGICMINSRETVGICADKYRTYLKLQEYGLTQPKTVLIPSVDHKESAIENLDTKFPIVMKTLAGSQGIGVLFVESEKSYDSLVQLLHNQNPSVDLLVQEYIKTDKDIRVIVLGGLVIASMQRQVIDGDFRSNVTQGSKVFTYKLSDLEIEQCLLASKAVNGVWTAVDFIPSKDPKTKPPLILEVNHSPGTEGIEKATGKNLVKEIIQHFENVKNRIKVPEQCGYLEVVNVKPFGDLVAKFDTGNALYPVLHAEDIKISKNEITFTHKDKTITTKLIGNYVSVTGGGEDKRPIVEFEFKFAGTNYGKIEFGLDNRDRLKTDVLLNRKIMKLMNVMVNPARSYVVTTKFSVEDK
jgi:ribosomal protein S6--L-glutamate ligase